MSIILNKKELATNKLRADALDILEAGLEAINTQKILRNKVLVENGVLYVKGLENGLDLKNFKKIIFVGIGKCALSGAKTMEEILGDYLTIGAAIDVRDATEAISLKKIKYFKGTHPLPSEQNILATKEIVEMIQDLDPKDLVISLISGGGSSLFELPARGFSLKDIIKKTDDMTKEGADIYKLNAVRKEMSQVKGGKFAKKCLPAKVVSLIFSDVLDNDISVIASGPTVPDLEDIKIKNILLCSNHDALISMQKRAESFGYKTKIATENLSGNATEVGKKLASIELEKNSCLLFGGETTVKVVENHGVGGRNQELILSALSCAKSDFLVAAIASDGWDNTDHAGAIADAEMLEKAKNSGLLLEQFLLKSDSYTFWKKINGAIFTGRLESNVSDLVIMIRSNE